MALTFSTLIDRGERTFPQQHGLVVKVVDCTLGVATTDYSSGIDISGNATELGFNKVLAVIDAGVRASSGTIKALVDRYNYDTGKLVLYATGSADGAVLTEIVASDRLANGDIVRMVVIGV